MSPIKTTPCTCTKAGWCERHQVKKTQHWYELCCNNIDYFVRWEKGVGLGQRNVNRNDLNVHKTAAIDRQQAEKQPPPRDLTEEDKKYIAICEKCEYYMGKRRCKLIEYGCRRDFITALLRRICPIGLWAESQKTFKNPENGV